MSVVGSLALNQLKAKLDASIVPKHLIAVFDSVRMAEKIFIVCSPKNVNKFASIVVCLRPCKVFVISCFEPGIARFTAVDCSICPRSEDYLSRGNNAAVKLHRFSVHKISAIVPNFQSNWFAATAVMPNLGPFHDGVDHNLSSSEIGSVKVFSCLLNLFQKHKWNLSTNGEIKLAICNSRLSGQSVRHLFCVISFLGCVDHLALSEHCQSLGLLSGALHFSKLILHDICLVLKNGVSSGGSQENSKSEIKHQPIFKRYELPCVGMLAVGGCFFLGVYGLFLPGARNEYASIVAGLGCVALALILFYHFVEFSLSGRFCLMCR